MYSFMNPVKKIYRKTEPNSAELIEESIEKCPECGNPNLSSQLKENGKVCKVCGYHYKMSATERIEYICDDKSFVEFNKEYTARDILKFEGYAEKLEQDRNKTGLNEAVITGIGKVKGIKCVLIIMESGFRMGSMGTVVGQKILEAADRAMTEKLPVISIIASGGARMQEGMYSLMQMSKTVSAFDDLKNAGLMTINILTNPTTGGVSASFAVLGDILLAEPRAIIGFAGKKVVAQTLKTDLPDGFQTAEFLKEHGHIDQIVSRGMQRDCLAKLLKRGVATKEVKEKEYYKSLQLNRRNLQPIEKLELVRRNDRLTTKDYIELLVEDFTELHGDRVTEDDKAIIAGIGYIDGIKAVFIGQQRGKDLDDNLYRNFGMVKPAGYRKASRIIKMAGRLGLPVITFVDTKGADPTANSEVQNQSEAIANCILTMVQSKVPNITVVIGEGGSGGALAIGTANIILMLENALFSVISPEGAASILWKDSNKVEKAMNNLRITAQDLDRMKIIDDIIPELEINSEEDAARQANIIKAYIVKYLKELMLMEYAMIIENRKNNNKNIWRLSKEDVNDGK